MNKVPWKKQENSQEIVTYYFKLFLRIVVTEKLPCRKKGRVIQSAFKTYPITLILIAINVIFFLLSYIPNLSLTSKLAMDTGLVLHQHQWYRTISSMFVHANIWHILMNMWCLWDIGKIVEPNLAEWKYALCYLGAGFCGSLVVMLSDTLRHSTGLTVGASGAIFGLFGVLLVMGMKHVLSLNMRVLIMDIVLMLLPGFFATGISLAGHIGGLLGGILIGLLIV